MINCFLFPAVETLMSTAPEVETHALLVDDRLPTGKGIYIWNFPRCGTPQQVADGCFDLGLNHVVIKVSDGVLDYPSTFEYDTAEMVRLLKAKGIQCWGYGFAYGDNPEEEAQKLHERIVELNLFGQVVNAESHFRPNRRVAAQNYMEELMRLAPTTPTCLSSNRYPITAWYDFPWGGFRNYINFDMPQVYWLEAHNAAWQLDKSYHEFMGMAPQLPYIPTGSAWKQSNWECTPADVIAFMDKAKALGLQAVNFWEYSRLRDLPLVWKAIAEYDYGVAPVPPEPEPIPEPEENMPDITKVKAARDALVEIYAKADEAATNLNDFIAEYEAQPPAPPVPPVPPTPPPPEPPATTWEMLVKPAQADDPRTKAFCYQVWNSTQGRLVEKVNANGKYIMQEYLSMGGARLTYNRGVKVRVYREIIDTEADGPIDYHELYVPLGDRGQRLFLLKADLMKLV